MSLWCHGDDDRLASVEVFVCCSFNIVMTERADSRRGFEMMVWGETE